MGTQNSASSQPVCLLDAQNSHRCTLDNPVVSYVKHLDDNEIVESMTAASDASQNSFDMSRFRKIGNELVSKLVLQQSVSEGKCFQVSRQKTDDELSEDATLPANGVDDNRIDEAVNWVCDDDLENYWQSNCILLHPSITTCMDELAILKHTGDAQNLDRALKAKRKKQLLLQIDSAEEA